MRLRKGAEAGKSLVPSRYELLERFRAPETVGIEIPSNRLSQIETLSRNERSNAQNKANGLRGSARRASNKEMTTDEE